MFDHRLFGKWLTRKLDEAHLSQSDLARITNVTRSTISGVITGRRQPSSRLMVSIAGALQIPPEEVFQAVGILPKTEKDNLEKINYLFALLTEREKTEVLDYIAFKVSQHEKGNNAPNSTIGLEETSLS